MTSPDITAHGTTLHHITPHYTTSQHITAHHSTLHHTPNSPFCCVKNSGAVVEWLMDKFNLDVSLVARVGGHSAPRTYRDPHLCSDSDGEEDCRKVRQSENDHQSTGDGVVHEWWCVFDECVDFCKKKRRRRRRRVRVFAHWCHLVVFGTRLAMCSVIWMEAREFAMLVPDPIAFAPWPGEPL